MAVRMAQDGANIALIAKTEEPHPKLEGTIYSAAEAIEEAGGQALPIAGDIRHEDEIKGAIKKTVDHFGGLDIVVNNAGAICLDDSNTLRSGRFDRMQQVNTRGTFLMSRCSIPHLRNSPNPHVLNLSPPINLAPKWPSAHLGWAISKYGMSICTLGMAEEFAADGIAFNSLWPRTLINTAPVQVILGPKSVARSRHPEIVADAAFAIVCRDSRKTTGNFFIDEDILREEGVVDFSAYAVNDPDDLELDKFVDE